MFDHIGEMMEAFFFSETNSAEVYSALLWKSHAEECSMDATNANA